jgi:hypothetical protein
MLKQFDGNNKLDAKNILTGDEMWTYHYNPGKKQMPMQ